ncbi:MAG: hypothetical protein H7Y22_03725 [Gemmatimonadaceae bacterium]|nr:hypothetical protein [Gloeobacterales cyanobacterium ES-bin-141]
MNELTSRDEVVDIRRFGSGSKSFDASAALQSALNRGYKNIHIPGGNWVFNKPVVVPPNTGVRIFGTSNAFSILECRMPNSYRDRGMIEYFARDGFSWGIVLEHLHLVGNGSTCHGLFLKQISYPLLKDISIEGFDGAGLLIDKCQDGEFINLNVQDCGRTSGNRKSLADRTDVSKTLYSAIHLTNMSTPGDANNMLRFNSLQCENNVTSPYIFVKVGVGVGPIGIFFSQIHGEVRNQSDWNTFEFLRAEAGDFNFDGVALSRFKPGAGFTFTGYGTATFANSRALDGVRHIKSGVAASFLISNCITNDLSCVGLDGGYLVSNSKVGKVSLSYPGASNQRFSNCDMGNVTIANSGGSSRGVYIINCTLGSLTTDANTSNGYYAFNTITGNLTGSGSGNNFINNLVLGKTQIAPGNFSSKSAALTAPISMAANPAALDPDFCRLEPLKPPSTQYSAPEAQRVAELVNRLQVLLNAEIARRKDLEARLMAAHLLSESPLLTDRNLSNDEPRL